VDDAPADGVCAYFATFLQEIATFLGTEQNYTEVAKFCGGGDELTPRESYLCLTFSINQDKYFDPARCGTTKAPLPTVSGADSLRTMADLVVPYLLMTLAGDDCYGKFLEEDYVLESELPLETNTLFLKDSADETCK